MKETKNNLNDVFQMHYLHLLVAFIVVTFFISFGIVFAAWQGPPSEPGDQNAPGYIENKGNNGNRQDNASINVSGNVASTGKLSGNQLCFTNDCKDSWDEVSGAIQDGNNFILNSIVSRATQANAGIDISGSVIAAGGIETQNNVISPSYCLGDDSNCIADWSEIETTPVWTTSGSSIYYNTGNVGIGTASPVYKLDIAGVNANLARFTYSFNGQSNIAVRNPNTGNLASSAIQLANATDYNAGLLRIGSNNSTYSGANSLMMYTFGNYPLGFVTNNAVRMTISGGGDVDINGNVGIGVNPNSYKLNIGGSSYGAYVYNSNGTEARLGYSTYGLYTRASYIGVYAYDTNNYSQGRLASGDYGVYGYDADGRGVYGQTSTGYGVYGYASGGYGLYGYNTSESSGWGLYVGNGRTFLDDDLYVNDGRIGVGNTNPGRGLDIYEKTSGGSSTAADAGIEIQSRSNYTSSSGASDPYPVGATLPSWTVYHQGNDWYSRANDWSGAVRNLYTKGTLTFNQDGKDIAHFELMYEEHPNNANYPDQWSGNLAVANGLSLGNKPVMTTAGPHNAPDPRYPNENTILHIDPFQQFNEIIMGTNSVDQNTDVRINWGDLHVPQGGIGIGADASSSYGLNINRYGSGAYIYNSQAASEARLAYSGYGGYFRGSNIGIYAYDTNNYSYGYLGYSGYGAYTYSL